MPLQPPNFFGLVDPLNPIGADSRTISDDYHRMILQSLKQQGPNWTKAITASADDLNLLGGYSSQGGKLMTGEAGVTTLFHYGNTAAPGWTVWEPDANIRELVIGPSVGGGTISGSDDPTNLQHTVSITINFPAATSPHTLTAAQSGLPAHFHSYTTHTGDSTSDNKVRAGTGGQSNNSPGQTTTAQGAGAVEAHSHNIGGSQTEQDNVVFTPRYARGVLMRLNA